jgi:hypothetical protein
VVKAVGSPYTCTTHSSSLQLSSQIQKRRGPMQLWYLSPFLLGWLVWWVATRKHPEEKERWTWAALGLTAGASVMFLLVYFSKPRTEGLSDSERQLIIPDAPLRGITLHGDSSAEVLRPTRVRQDLALSIGSLQLTLLAAYEDYATIQIEPVDKIEHFEYQEWFDQRSADSAAERMRLGNTVTLGKYASFAYRGRLYRLDLLEIQWPMKGLNRKPLRDWFDLYAVIRLLDVGIFPDCKRYSDTMDMLSKAPKVARGKRALNSTGGANIPAPKKTSGRVTPVTPAAFFGEIASPVDTRSGPPRGCV